MNVQENTQVNIGQSALQKWLPLVMLSFAILVIVLDTTILNVSLRTIIGDLGTTIQKIQWVITAYSLTLAALTITGGRLGDLFGRKKMFIVGAIIFAVGSFITSVSHSVGMMIFGEAVIEGIGAALMMPATSSLLVANYKGRDRQLAFGIWGGIAAAGAALGPVFGGWLTTFYSWRWAFRINIFIVIILIAGSFLIKESRDRAEKAELDIGGVILSSLGLLSLVFGFIEASTYGWVKAKTVFTIGNFALNFGVVSVVVPAILLGLIILTLFILWEIRRERRKETPLVSVDLFKNTQFTVGASVLAIVMLGQSGMSFALPVFFQSVKNLDAFHTGLAMLPMALTILVFAPLSAYLSKFFTPKRIIQSGLIVNVVGYIALIAGIQTAGSVWVLVPGFILFGIGMGCLFSQANNMTLSAVSVEQAGEASGVNNTLRTIGQTLGSAILGAILLSGISSNLVMNVEASSVIPVSLKPELERVMVKQSSNIEFGNGSDITGGTSENITSEIKTLSRKATVEASHTTMWYGMAFTILAFLLAFKLPNSKDVEVEKSLVSVH
jgi:EmrB/QacA subfamily drug resistance transporter